jgi:hypothetical protein
MVPCAACGGLSAARFREDVMWTVRRCEADEVVPLRGEILRPGLPLETARFDGDLHPGARHWRVDDPDDALRALAVVSVLVALPPEAPAAQAPSLQLRGMAAARPGGGVGAVLLRAVHDQVAAPMWCNARLRAVPFYARLGWTITSDLFDIPGVGPHHRMLWEPS